MDGDGVSGHCTMRPPESLVEEIDEIAKVKCMKTCKHMELCVNSCRSWLPSMSTFCKRRE